MERIKTIFEQDGNCLDIKFPKGTTIYMQGSPVSGLFLLLKGVVKLSTLDADGKEIIVKIILPGQLIGQRCFFTKKTYGMNAFVMEDAEVKFLDTKIVMEKLTDDAQFSESFIRVLGMELEEADNKSRSLMTKNVGQRLIEFLLNFSGCSETQGKPSLNFHLSREEMASLIGTTPETITRYLSSFKDKGLLEEKNRIIFINEPEGLKSYAGGI